MGAEFVLAFDYGGTKIAVGSASLDGQLIARTELRTADYGDAQSVVQAGIHAGLDLMEETQRHRAGAVVTSIGVSTMGVTQPDRVLLAPNVPGWAELGIEGMFQSAFPGLPIAIENDVKCAALAELRRGELRDVDYGIYLNLGTGIMVVLTADGKIMRGHHGASGEIAYNLLSTRPAKGVQEGVAPLEEVVGGRFIGIRGSAHFQRTITAKDLFELYRVGDAEARRFLDDTLEELAYHLVNLCTVWDPDRVVLGGGMVGAHDVILPVLCPYLTRYVPFPPEIRIAKFQNDAALHGAVELAISATRDI
ncbi:MAG: ROK family protein [Alicyclobacillus sp.]|nr:ROK family protein [Alicyclobacillus sp.]